MKAIQCMRLSPQKLMILYNNVSYSSKVSLSKTDKTDTSVALVWNTDTSQVPNWQLH